MVPWWLLWQMEITKLRKLAAWIYMLQNSDCVYVTLYMIIITLSSVNVQQKWNFYVLVNYNSVVGCFQSSCWSRVSRVGHECTLWFHVLQYLFTSNCYSFNQLLGDKLNCQFWRVRTVIQHFIFKNKRAWIVPR